MGIRNFLRNLPSFTTMNEPPFSIKLIPGYLLAVVVFLLALLIQFELDGHLPPGFPFLTLFPAVVFVAFVSGLWPGLVISTLGLIASWYYFLPPAYSFALDLGTFLALAFYIFVVGVDLTLITLVLRAFRQSEELALKNTEANDFQKLLIRELDHRIKNLFAVVAAVVKLSAKEAETPQELAATASDRIMALSRSHSSLWNFDARAQPTVSSLVREVLEPYLADYASRIDIADPSPQLDLRQIQILSLIFHELATNAMKYGALSASSGTIRIRSETDPGSQNAVVVDWTETGLKKHDDDDQRSGFGSELITRLVESIGGSFDRHFENDTMHARATVPVT